MSFNTLIMRQKIDDEHYLNLHSSPHLLLYSQSRKNQSDEHDGGEGGEKNKDRFSATDSHSWYVHCTFPTRIWHF